MFSLKFKDVKKAVNDNLTLDQARAEMLELLTTDNVNHHRLGQLVNYISDNKLAENAGYKNAVDFFRKHLCDVSPATLFMYGAVAAAFGEDIARRFGVTCLSLLLTYKEAADIEVNHDAPGDTPIEVPGENGAVTAKRFGDCTVDEMRKALQRKRKPASSKPLPPEDLTLVDQVRESVTGRFTKADAVRVQVRNHKGKAVVDFKGIPLAQLPKLAEALLAPPPTSPEVSVQKTALQA